jgi:hypothetical protein
MKRTILAFLLFVTCNIAVEAQEPAEVRHPGDTVRIVVTFKSPVDADSVRFQILLTGQLDSRQQGFTNGFWSAGSGQKRSPTEYELTGTIPGNIATGAYRLVTVRLVVKGAERDYYLEKDFQKVVELRIDNPATVSFPEIKDLKSEPPL